MHAEKQDIFKRIAEAPGEEITEKKIHISEEETTMTRNTEGETITREEIKGKTVYRNPNPSRTIEMKETLLGSPFMKVRPTKRTTLDSRYKTNENYKVFIV